MADAEETSEELSRSRSRSSSSIIHAAKWRDKLKEKAGKLKSLSQPSVEEQHSNVSDFLGKASDDSDNRQMNLGLQIPTNDKLDPASYAPAPIQRKRPARKSKGLNVSFSDEEADIIGEGGDECELPTQHVIGSWTARQNLSGINNLRRESIELPASLSTGSSQELLAPDRYDRRQSFQRAPTRKPVGGWERKRSSMTMEERLVQANKAEEISQTSNALTRSPGSTSLEPPQASDVHGIGILQQPSYRVDRESDLLRLTGPTAPHSSMSPPLLSKPPNSSAAAYLAFDPSRAVPINLKKSDAGIERHVSHMHERDEPQLHLDNAQFAPKQSLQTGLDVYPTSNYQQPRKNGPEHHQNTVGQAESDDFYSRVQHLRSVFRLAAEKADSVESRALEHWLRMASWWFVRGKTTIEKNAKVLIEEPERTAGNEPSQRSQQPYVDLAKAWWSVEDVLPDLIGPHSHASKSNKLDTIDGLKYSQLLDVYSTLQVALKDFAIFMHHNNLLPPQALLIQGCDPCIWFTSPALSHRILSLAGFLDPRTLAKRTKRPFFPIILRDTDHWFCYGQVFATAEIQSNDGSEANRMPCIMSAIRDTSHQDMQLTITSQDGQINLHVQSDPNQGPIWEHIDWRPKEHAFVLPLSKECQLEVRMREDDFRLISSLSNSTFQDGIPWHPTECEEVLFDDVIPVFHCTGMEETASFPTTPVKKSAVRLFRRTAVTVEGATQRRFFDGYRLVARTPSTYKNLKILEHVFARTAPILCSNLRGENEAPALLLVFRDRQTKASLILTFKNLEQRSYFHGAMSGVVALPKEVSSKDIPLVSMNVIDLFTETGSGIPTHTLSSVIRWSSTRVISEPQSEGLKHIMVSDHLRVCSTSNLGTVVDLANLSMGELQMSLEVSDVKTIKLYRPARDSLIVSFADNQFLKEEYTALQATLLTTSQRPTARVYTFPSLDALHTFQKLITGFDVIYDGMATAFSVSHRRNMIPLYKKQEATHARLQLLVHNNRGQKTYQLIAVLSDFPEGKIMNFQIRSSDIFETTFKSGKHCVRLVDAKFALPKHPDSKDMPWDFVCLDVPEYPAEHDDIVIGFDTEQGRDTFAKTLPAQIKVSRLQSLRR